ncbi:MAG: hypothetical protein Aurels2KO_25510 [Aureliella sp.]
MFYKVLATQENVHNLTGGGASVFSGVVDASNNRMCRMSLYFGDGTNDLEGSGGVVEVTLSIGGNAVNGGRESQLLGASSRAYMQSEAFLVRAGETLDVAISSANGGDTSVNVEAVVAAEDVVSASQVLNLLEADQDLVDDVGVRKLTTLLRGTSTELIPAKTAKRTDGANLTDPATEKLSGYVQS